jgi:inorganic pyrophosphatase
MIFTAFIGLLFIVHIIQGTITTRQIGALNSLNYSLYFENDKEIISPFHDIPLFANDEKTLFNMIIEIPKWTNAKNEINKETQFNPIKQDTSNQSPRFIPNIFPYKGYIWNYGAFPQTWEDPGFISPFTGKMGDNDPIDVIEIGQSIGSVGEIRQVKILGIIGLIDQDETDWKVVVIDHNDPISNNLTDIEDVEKFMPGYLNATYALFKIYKIPEGKPENTIAFNEQAQNKTFATDIVLETHEHWQLLINGTTPRKEIQTINTSVNGSIYKVKPKDDAVKKVPKARPEPPASIDLSNTIWYFI